MARHPESGEPILASIGRYGPYVQHGKTYANIGKDDDVLEIGGNRAIDLIVAKESGGGVRAAARPIPAASRRRSGDSAQAHRGQGRPLRPLRDRRRDQRHPAARSMSAEAVTLEEAIALLMQRAAGRQARQEAGPRPQGSGQRRAERPRKTAASEEGSGEAAAGAGQERGEEIRRQARLLPPRPRQKRRAAAQEG